MSATCSRDGIEFAYLDEGSGSAFVVQHGPGGDSSQLRSLWRGSGRLLSLECRGHGRTAPLGPTADLSCATPSNPTYEEQGSVARCSTRSRTPPGAPATESCR